MTGSSHMRYFWDAVVADKTRDTKFLKPLLAHHSDEKSFTPIVFAQNYFARDVAAYINFLCSDIQYDLKHGSTPANYTVVFETGAWDTTYWFPRLVMNVTAPALLETIREAVITGCGAYLRLIWVTALPYPHCDLFGMPEQSIHCEENRYGRNNYAIAAFNEFFRKSLEEINYPNLQIVDAFDIVEPRLEFGETGPCGHHYYCRESCKEKFTATPAGRIVVEAIERAICKAADGKG